VSETNEEQRDPIAQVREFLRQGAVPHPDDVRVLLGAFDSRGRQLDTLAADLNAAQQREAEYVDRLAGKAPSIRGPIPDQPGALDELRQLLAADVLATRDTRHARMLADALAVEWSHYTGLRRQWQRKANDHSAALAALPETVRPYPGEPPTTLADRVGALRGYYDMCRAGWGRCHMRHLDVERAARAVLAWADGTGEERRGRLPVDALREVLERHRADGDDSHIPADHPSRSMSRHVEIVAAVRRLLDALDDQPVSHAVGWSRTAVRELLDGDPVEDTGPGVHTVEVSG